MQSRPAEVEEITHLVGSLDDIVIAKILATHATADELREAWERLTQDDGIAQHHPGMVSARVLQLMEIIEDAWGAEEEGSEATS